MKVRLNTWCNLLLLSLVLGTAQPASAALYELYTFTPPDADIFDLDHYKFYTWGINWTPEPNEKIVWAQVSIRNINNWTVEEDRLYIELLDYAKLGLKTFDDNQGGGNNFASWGANHLFLTSYTDLDDDNGALPGGLPENFKYQFDLAQLATLNDWIDDGRIGLAFDPDCHYWNDGVKFKFKTQIVTPEPASMALFASGLVGAISLRRKNKKG